MRFYTNQEGCGKMLRILSWLRHPLSRKGKPLNATKTIAVVFAVIILVGALLLTLPVSSRSGESCGFLPALFTATSTTCVTGLVLFDTFTQWSGFGQTVIITLIQIGGLGFMSIASMVVFTLRRKVGLKQRMVMAQALSLNEMDGVVRLQKWVIFGSLSVQLVGALILFLRFLPSAGWLQAAKWGIFHAVSAFCNAGFDIFGNGVKIEADIRNEMFGHMEKLSSRYFHENKTGALMALYTNDLSMIKQAFASGTLMLFDAIALGSLAFMEMLKLDWKLTIVCFIPLVFVSGFSMLMRKRISRKVKKNLDAFADL